MKSWEYQDSVFGSSLSANAKLTALAIAYHYNWEEARKSFPSISLLVKRTSLSKATVHRAKNELVEAGWLKSTRRHNKSNLYLPQIPSLPQRFDQSQTETLVVSQGRTNNEGNNEGNNEAPSSSYELLGSSNTNSNTEQEVWRIFDNEERYTRPRPARPSNRKSRQSNKDAGRNNPDSEELARFSEELANARNEQW